MNPNDIFCPNIDCPARGQIGKRNISVHSQKEKRYICNVCQQTFTTTKGTIYYRLRTEPKTVMQVVGLLAYGCPIQAIVHAFEIDERTVRDWWERAGKHCQKVHEHKVEQGPLGLAASASGRDQSEESERIFLDGISDHGLYSLMVGRGSQPAPRPGSDPGIDR